MIVGGLILLLGWAFGGRVIGVLWGVVWVGGAGRVAGWGLAGWPWCPRALVSGPRSLGSVRVGWLVVRAVRWSVVVGPLWFMFAHFR